MQTTNLIEAPEQNAPIPKSKRLLMEDVNVVRLEGRYFCFNGREAAKRIHASLSFEDGKGGNITIETGRRGQPSVLAYRLLQAIFRQITVCGRPYPASVAFTRRELGRLVGRKSFGGRDAQEILHALYQLQDTHITLGGQTGKAQVFENRFNLLVQVCSIWEKDEHALRRQGLLDAIAIELHPAVARNIAQGQIAIFNWPMLEILEPLQAALYKRLYLHFSNLYDMNGQKPHALAFEKAYTAICSEWLGGLQCYRYPSDIEKQLRPHLAPLIEKGFILNYTIEPLAKGEGFKLKFAPGKGFFADFEAFYRLKFSKQAESPLLVQGMAEPIALVQAFYKTTKGGDLPETSLAKGDITYAEELIGALGASEAKAFVTHSIERARASHYNMMSFRGLKVYLPDWQAAQKRRDQQNALDAAQHRKSASIHLQRAYDEQLAAHIETQLAGCSEAEREQMHAQAEAHILATYGKGRSFAQMVKNQIERAVLDQSPFPDFETWTKLQQE